MSGNDNYFATAGAYDVFSVPARPAYEAALRQLLALVRPGTGPVMDIGSGSGSNFHYVLEREPDLEVWAIEPSAAMRALAMVKLAAHPEWHDRITLWPDDFFSAELPERIGGALLAGVIGHFDAGGRRALLAELSGRLPAGAPVLVDLQAPERPERVEPYEYTAATIGELTYRMIAEAWPTEGEAMRWRMSYLTLRGDFVLDEATTEHVYYHLTPEVVAEEARRAGFTPYPLEQETFWLLTRDDK